jgi:hypothetical protein
MGATTAKPFVFNMDTNGRYGMLYLSVSADEAFLLAVRALPQVAGVQGEHVAIKIEVNPVFNNKVLETLLSPLVDVLIVRQTELKPYTPNYEFIYANGGHSGDHDTENTNYLIYLQTEPDEELLEALSSDPGTMASKYEEGERRFQLVRFAAYSDNEYCPRVKRYLEDFLLRQA